MSNQQMQDSRGGAAPQQIKYWEPNYVSSPLAPSTPGTGMSSSSSRDSTGSSVGSIPEFPVPTLPANPPSGVQFRRNGNLGPPPSARRGAPSYYSQSSYVAPIPEESWESSSPARRAFPGERRDLRGWNDDEPDCYGTRGPEDDGSDDRDSRSTDPDDTTGLVGKASLGKQCEPALPVQSSREAASTKHADGVGRAATESIPVMLDDIHNTTFLRGPSEESEASKEMLAEKESPSMPQSTAARRVPVDPEVELIISGLERGGALKSGTMAPMIIDVDGRSSPLRGPPPLDPDRPRQGAARSSLTSLTDLIRRATRVAANLEKGRTASRLGTLDMFNQSNPNLLKGGADEPRRPSVSDMLASFPAPALGTPSRSLRTESRPSPFANSNLNLARGSSHDVEKHDQRRSCCGMPLRLFVLLLLLLLGLIAAAVVIPIVLIVLPKQNRSPPPPSNPLANCPASQPCSNGGVSVISSNSCRCICTNGFTGSSCANAAVAPSVCTTTDVASFQKVTLGTSIPRLFTGASSNFSVPLNATALLSDFSASELACADENHLVSFSNTPNRRDLPHPIQEYVAPLPRVALAARVADPEPQSPSAVTVDGIVFNGQGPTSTAPNLATTAGPTPTPTPTSSSSGPLSTQLDFASVAILYIFQQTQLSVAADAQTMLQDAFNSGSFSGPVLITSNITVDVTLMRITMGNATVGKMN